MKRLIMLIMALCCLFYAKAQTFSQGVGYTVLYTSIPGWYSSPGATNGVTYVPKCRFLDAKDFSLSLDVPLSFGVGYVKDYGDVDHHLSYLFNGSMLVNFNLGAGSTVHNKSRLGFFAGGGFGYQYASYNYYGDNTPYEVNIHWSLINYGPVGDIGMRIAVGKGTQNIEIRGMYMKALDETKANIFGGEAGFNF